jgi:hypothetical protein
MGHRAEPRTTMAAPIQFGTSGRVSLNPIAPQVGRRMQCRVKTCNETDRLRADIMTPVCNEVK